MATLTVRNLDDEAYLALKIRAAGNGRSMEAEARDIVSSTVLPEQRLRLGDALSQLGRNAGLSNEDFDVFEHVRDSSPAQPVQL